MSSTDPNILVPDPAAPDDPNPDPGTDPAGPDPASAPTPPQDDPTVTARIAEAVANARADAYKDALATVGQRQDPATTAQVVPPPFIPDDPMQSFTPAERENLKTLQLTNPEEALNIVSKRSMALAEARMQQQAQPLVASQASTLVELYISRRSAGVSPQMAAQIVPIFRAKMGQAGDLRPLVTMTDPVREGELALRWDSAEAEVLRKAAANPPRPDPLLVAGGGGVSQPAGGLKKSVIEDDPVVAAMAKAYNFTPAQIAELEKEYT